MPNSFAFYSRLLSLAVCAPALIAGAAALTGLVGFSQVAAARDLFVNNVTGDDVLDGTAPEGQHLGQGPFRTIAKALRVAGAGDHIELANTGQPYREQVAVV